MKLAVRSVRRSVIMSPQWICVGLFFTLTTFLGNADGQSNSDKRNKPVWYRARFEHEGSGLTNQQVRTIAAMEDMQHFKKVLEPIMVPRVVGTEGHTKVRKHLINTMEGLGWTVEEDSFEDRTPVGRKTFTNVIATLNPDAPRHLVLACHYDSKLDREGEFIGATDSAVPCAMMLNLAYVMRNALFQHSKLKSDLTLRFIFIDGEEAFRQWSDSDSLYGARHMAASMETRAYPTNTIAGTNELHRMDLFVLLDLLGTSDVNFFNYFENTTPWYSRMVSYERRLRELQLLHPRKKYIFQNKPLFNAGIQDDHLPFLRRGVPVLHLIPVPFPRVWHKVHDRKEALHYRTIESLNKIMRNFVADYLHLEI